MPRTFGAARIRALGATRGRSYSGSGGTPAFDPSTIAGLQLWLKADAITGLSDADPVTTWEDSHTSNHDATQATGAAKPIYKTGIVNGKPVVRFDGVDDFLGLTSLPAGAAKTLIIVAKQRINNAVND